MYKLTAPNAIEQVMNTPAFVQLCKEQMAKKVQEAKDEFRMYNESAIVFAEIPNFPPHVQKLVCTLQESLLVQAFMYHTTTSEWQTQINFEKAKFEQEEYDRVKAQRSSGTNCDARDQRQKRKC
jgi:hypothetical protein